MSEIKRVFVVVLENTDASDALKQPFLSSLTRTGALLSNYHALSHPSEPNYLALVGGSTFGVADDDNVTLAQSQLGDLVEAAGKQWKSYAESYPGNCYLAATSGDYARKHEPFLSFSSVSGNPARCARVVNASTLDSDIQQGTLPDYALYVPNLQNDGHDTGVAFADAWLSRVFGPRLQNPAFIQGTLFIVTFDEAGGSHTNQIYTAFYGAGVQPGATSSDCYTHYDLLRTVESALGLGSLGRGDAAGATISGVWK